MGLHIPNSVEDEPMAVLGPWSVIQVYSERHKDVLSETRHFYGYNHVTGTGRVSSPIQSWDPVTRVGVTRSGRRYALKDEPPRKHEDGDYVLGQWLTHNSVDRVTDVSHEYWIGHA